MTEIFFFWFISAISSIQFHLRFFIFNTLNLFFILYSSCKFLFPRFLHSFYTFPHVTPPPHNWLLIHLISLIISLLPNLLYLVFRYDLIFPLFQFLLLHRSPFIQSLFFHRFSLKHMFSTLRICFGSVGPQIRSQSLFKLEESFWQHQALKEILISYYYSSWFLFNKFLVPDRLVPGT